MRIGGTDGFGDVYTFTSKRSSRFSATTIAATPIIRGGETMVAAFPRVFLRIKGAEAGIFDSGDGGYPGDCRGGVYRFEPGIRQGTLYITNRRIIFLRRRVDWKDGYQTFKRLARRRPSAEFMLQNILACGAIEFCEILLEDIQQMHTGIFGLKILIETQGRVYALRLTRKQARRLSDSEGLKRLRHSPVT
jgi:hypothetical protein